MKQAALIAALLAPAQAGAFELSMPVDCTLGESCFIQQYADRDSGPGATDFTCGPLSYDKHSGTDFALPTVAAMQGGVAVLAAAPGVVKGVRDGMPDIAVTDPAAPALDGRECGNGVLIDHGDGWQTQYCHMRQGSVAVAPGAQVVVGTPLGLVGMSGAAAFPHMHLSVRKDRAEIDPFDPDGSFTCGETPAPALWTTPLPYQAGGLIGIGFAEAVPEFAAIKAGLVTADPFPATAPALVVWVHAFGGREGDEITLAITGPAGEVVRQTVTLDRTQAQLFRATGLRLRAAAWPAGLYEGTATLTREGVEVDSLSRSIKVGP